MRHYWDAEFRFRKVEPETYEATRYAVIADGVEIGFVASKRNEVWAKNGAGVRLYRQAQVTDWGSTPEDRGTIRYFHQDTRQSAAHMLFEKVQREKAAA